jgi:hypothetical protein
MSQNNGIFSVKSSFFLFFLPLLHLIGQVRGQPNDSRTQEDYKKIHFCWDEFSVKYKLMKKNERGIPNFLLK